MDTSPLPDVTAQFARTVGPAPDPVIEEMDDRADTADFPTVGPAMGGWLRLLARAVDATRIFEFGSGFGYSAYWMAPAVSSDGRIVLTDVDESNLRDARDYFERGGYADRAVFEHGDAIETVRGYDGPFDLTLIDNEKARYIEAFEAVREKVRPGGLVVADNAIEAGPIEFADIRALLAGESVAASAESEGIADYLEMVRADEAFETALLPVGEGATVSVRVA
jgi:predicted O-methyltransferase YrrM